MPFTILGRVAGAWLALAFGGAAAPAPAQTAADHAPDLPVGAEDREPAVALAHFEAVLARDSTQYEANWRAALALVNLGKRTPDAEKSPARDSLYARAETYARRAVAAKLLGADGHFALAIAIGRASLTRGPRERVARAAEIRVEALKALELDPRHDGAHHVLGRWHAEIMRLSGITRFVARHVLGAEVFAEASWEAALQHLERAVALNPGNIYHRLDLAEAYLDRRRPAEARGQLEALLALPAVDAMDPTYQRRAADLLADLPAR